MGDRLPDSERYDDSYVWHAERRSLYRPSNQIAQWYELMEIHRLNWTLPQDSFDFGTNAPTALLVHGFGCQRGVMSHLGEELKKTMNVAYAGNFPNLNRCSLLEAATMLVSTLSEISKQYKDVTLIGHSNGWLIILTTIFMAKLRASRAITMGTPFGGAPRAERLAHLFPSCREVNKPGWFLGKTDFTDFLDEGILAMVAGNDGMVPPNSQRPYSLEGEISTYTIDDAGHFGFLIGDRVRETAHVIRRVLYQTRLPEALHAA